MMMRLLLLAIVLVSTSGPAIAQTTGVLKGLIMDSEGAVIPKAKVELKSTAIEQQKYTNSLGEYSFAAVPIGHYRLRVTAQGFHGAFNYEIDFSGSKAASYDFALAPCSDEPSNRRSEPFDDSDSAAIGRQLLLPLIPTTDLPPDKRPILEAESVDPSWLTSKQASHLRIMSHLEIRTLAERTKDQEYWWVSPLQLRGGCVEVSLFNDLIPHDRGRVTWGGEAKVYEFRKVNGKWIGFLFGERVS